MKHLLSYTFAIFVLAFGCTERRQEQAFKQERDTLTSLNEIFETQDTNMLVQALRVIPGQSWQKWSLSDSAFNLLSQNFSAEQERILDDDSLRAWIGQWVNDSVTGDGAGSTIGINLIPLGQGSATLTTGDLSFTNVTKRLNIGASGDRIEIDGDGGDFYFDGTTAGFFESSEYYFDDRIVAGGDFSDQFIVDSQGDSVLITKELSNAVISIKGDTVNLYGVAKYNGVELGAGGTDIVNMFGTLDESKIRFVNLILRPTYNPLVDDTIRWSILTTAGHTPTNIIDSITFPSAVQLRIHFADSFANVLSFHASIDDAFASEVGAIVGASVSYKYADLEIATNGMQLRQICTHNGSTWTYAGNTFATLNQAGTTIEINNDITDNYNNANYSFANIIAIYAGTNNRYLRQVYSGLGFNETKYALIDPTTGTAQSPGSGDRIIIWRPNLTYRMQTRVVQDVEKWFYDNSTLPAIFITGIFEAN